MSNIIILKESQLKCLFSYIFELTFRYTGCIKFRAPNESIWATNKLRAK